MSYPYGGGFPSQGGYPPVAGYPPAQPNYPGQLAQYPAMPGPSPGAPCGGNMMGTGDLPYGMYPSGAGNLGFNVGIPTGAPVGMLPFGGYPPQPGALGPGYDAPIPMSTQPGYPPSQPGYPSTQSVGYPSSQPGYPSAQSVGYPSSQPGYPSTQSMGYPSSQPGYPSGAVQPPVPGPSAPGLQPSYPGLSTGTAGVSTGPVGNVPRVKDEGTLKPYGPFNAENDAKLLRKAMKGFGTDEKAIIDILACRSNKQRQEVKIMYKTCFGKDLASDLKSEVSGRFEDAVLALLYTPIDYDVMHLHKAIEGAGTDENALIEILCTRSSEQIRAINETYKKLYGRTLEKDLRGDVSGHFGRLLVSLSVGGRMDNQLVDPVKAEQDAKKLYEAGEKRWGTDESQFNAILASQGFSQLHAVFDAYKKVSGHDIEQAIVREMSGDLANGMLAVVKVVRNKAVFFAEQLYHSMKGMGTNDRTLIRIIVSRCEVDMKQIKQEFQTKYGQSLVKFIRDDCSGDYKRILLTLIGGSP